jgi:hypothetical protein
LNNEGGYSLGDFTKSYIYKQVFHVTPDDGIVCRNILSSL